MRKTILFLMIGIMSLILLVGCNKRYNPATDECYGYSDSYNTFLDGEG